MLNPKFIRDHLNIVSASFKKRGLNENLNTFYLLEEQRRKFIKQIEDKKAIRNKVSKEIGLQKDQRGLKKTLLDQMKRLALEIKKDEQILTQVEQKVFDCCLHFPNLLADEVPEGQGAKDNQEIRQWGKPKEFSFQVKDHVFLAEELDLIDFKRGAKTSGRNFVFMKVLGAKLERALIAFFLDENIKKGYQEYACPFIVNEESLIATGQLPKFKKDLFQLKTKSPFYLIPTTEVPLTNLFRNEIIQATSLPIKLTGVSACFREEAGASGIETKGIIRQHQFNKVELVKITKPEHSKQEHESLLDDVEDLLKKLKLPYRVMLLCSKETGFGAYKCYDVEVWLPSKKGYVEISSCSNFLDFQANRALIRYKAEKENIPVHTLNASALAVGRTIVAILENYQNEQGRIEVPEVLSPYLGKKII